ncbi:MAG: gamma-glutamyl-gamma-aminobutyrate hydrolase family protein [Actinomycetota bacterium]|nr:gamma-glutamyl-gamma-aminobutyrate hydrolase family protein [Actinomycetota bacterium]
MTPAVVGITAAPHRASWSVWSGVEANISQRTYTLAVADAGAVPVLLPPAEGGACDPEAVLEVVDALILSGGGDLDPALYGAEAQAEVQEPNRDRDAFELALARCALERGQPVLGICRGMELLNVACGGTLEQHLAGADRHLLTAGTFTEHDVRLEPGSLAASAAGREHVTVRSHHHQGLAELGEGVVATGWSEPDGVIEAIELPEQRFALGVLWHTEETRRSPVVAALARAAFAQKVAA